MGFEFQYIYYAALFIIVLVICFLFANLKCWKKSVANNMGDPSLVQFLIRRYNPARFNLKFILITLAFIMGVLCVMSLRKPGGDDGVKRKGIDMVFALDLSKSMLAKDIEPNRLEMAKSFINAMMASRPDNRVGLVWFAGKAYVQMPISMDHNAAGMFVADASPDAVPVKGTVLGDALEESLKLFGDYEAKYKAVILISDGEDHDQKAIDISADMAKRGLMISTVGIGSPQGTSIPDDSTGGNKIDPETGQEIISRLNEKELKQIAANTNGVYVHLTDIKEAVKLINEQLAQIDQKVTADTTLMSFTYYFWVFAGLMLILLITEQLLPEGRTRELSINS